MLVKGHPANTNDMIVRRMEPRSLETILVDFSPLPGSKLGELNANWDIVLGETAEELEEIKGIGRSPGGGMGVRRRR
jgi:protocatechuate 3,4-dioxygenase beta subunit